MLLILTGIYIFLDLYTYFGMRGIIDSDRGAKIFSFVYIGLSLFTYYSILQTYSYFTKSMNTRTEMINFMSGFIFTMLITKIVFGAIMLMQDGGRVIIGIGQYLKHLFDNNAEDVSNGFLPERRKFISTGATMLAAVPFFSMLYGITKGKYQYTVEKIVLTFDNLPKSFDGFRLVQISDIHSGSFDSREKVMMGIQKINDLDADIVCFTGDLVNSEKEEIDPYIDIFAKITAKKGKYAILGNHDYYGSYDRNNPIAEDEYFKDFFTKYEQMGFDLLNNSHRQITIDHESINLIGVENWGAGRWFPKKGDLDIASRDTADGDFNILLSHDPTHWEEKVLDHPKHMHLTLSGHTHGFQFGFQLPGFQWSPAKYRYSRWAGLYTELNKHLYVNRGFGFLGFPGRIGMWPEITLIELRSA